MNAFDRTLTALAAQAAGRTLHWSTTEGVAPRDAITWATWDPLHDRGTALDLACELRINIEHMKTLTGKPFGINCWPTGRGDCGVTEEGDLSDYKAKTCRAIVRSAAAMGHTVQGITA